jgi:hypothetical protein
VTRFERIAARRDHAWRRWRAFRSVFCDLAPIVGWRAWRLLLAWDALYHEELRTNPAALAAAKGR